MTTALRRLLVALTILAMIALIGWLLHDAGYLRQDGLTRLVDDSGVWGPAILIGAMILAILGPVPTIPITMASGLLFGPVAGFAYAVTGALAGALLSFWVARFAGRPVIARFTRGHVAVCQDCSDRLLFWVVLCSRVLPFVSFAMVSYGAGLTAMSAKAFALATAVGMIPMTALYIAMGASLAIAPLWTAVGGVFVVTLILILPWLVERFNPFGLRDLLRHATTRDPDDRLM